MNDSILTYLNIATTNTHFAYLWFKIYQYASC